MPGRPISVKLKAEDADSIVNALRASGAAGQKMADDLEKSFTPTARAVDNLRRSLDPLYDSQQKVASATGVLDRALKAGTVSAQLHSEMLTLLNNRYAPAITGTNKFGLAIQQAGFQVGDFAVQVASGQGAMRAFVQQGSQMLQFFGPFGAIAGAALAVVGALATAFISVGDSTEKATEAQKKHNDELSRAKQLEQDLVNASQERARAIEAERRNLVAKADAELEAVKKTLQAYQAPQLLGITLPGQPQVSQADIDKLIQSLTLEQRVNSLVARGYAGEYDDLGRRGGSPTSKSDELDLNKVVRQRDEAIEANDRLAASIQKVGVARDLAAARAAVEAKAENDAVTFTNKSVLIRQAEREVILRVVGAGTQQVDTLERETAARQAVADAAKQGTDAAHEAEVQAKVDIATLTQRQALQYADVEQKKQLVAQILQITAAIRNQDQAERDTAVRAAIEAQQDQLKLGQAELDLMGKSAQERELVIARLQAEVDLRKLHIDTLSDEGQAYIANSEALAKQRLELERQDDAWKEVEDFGEKAFDALIQKATDSGVKIKDVVKSVGAEFEALVLRMAAINPLKNAAFGTNLPTFSDLSGILGNLGYGGETASGGFGLGSVSGLLNNAGSYLGFGSVAPRPSPDFVGPMPFNPGVFGGTTFTQFLGGAGLGFGAGSLLNSALGRTGARATNGTIGAGVGALGGALIGSLIPGVGTILGGLLGGAAGGGLGGLIGPKPSVGPGQGATLAFTDFARVYGAAADNGGDASAAAAWAGAIGQAVAQAIQASGGTGLAGGGRSVSIFNNKNGFNVKLGGDNTGTLYGSQDEANAAALQYLLGGGITGASGSINTAIQHSLAGGNANNLLSDIQFARSIDRLGLSQVEQQVAALNDQYGQQIDRAQKLGLATDELIKKRDEDIAATRNAAQVAAQQNALTASGGAASTIYSFLNAQSLSADSSLSPTGRLTEAQRQFGDLLSAVRGGDLSQTGALTQAAGNLLTIGRQNYASSVDFTNIESFVRSSLKGVASTVTSDQYIADQITKAIAAADKTQADRDAQLVSTLKTEMALLRSKIEALAA